MSADPDRSTSELVAAAVTGEPLAMDRLLLRMTPRVAARVERRLPRELRATCSPDDVLQDSLAQAFSAVRGFRVPDHGPEAGEAFFQWLARIADNRIIDLIRAHRAAKRGGGRAATHMLSRTSSVVDLVELVGVHSRTPSRSASGHETGAALRAAMQSLSPDHRTVLELRFFQGLSPGEIAARMNRSEHAVHNLCTRAVGALRGALGGGSDATL